MASDSKVHDGPSKLQEQATGKADLSYSYWAANTTTTATIEPRKLTGKDLEEHLEKESKLCRSGSAWNAAGTFEEKNLISWAKATVEELFVGSGTGDVEIIEILSCDGDACQLIIRGSPRAHFDLNIKFKYKNRQSDGEGTARVPNACWDELDELEIQEVSNAGDAQSVKQLVPVVKAKLEELLNRIKKYGIEN